MRIIIIFLLALCFTNSALAKLCSRQDAIDAETGELPDWNAVYKSYQRFVPQCDDAAISEGYSDSVGQLLAYKWGALPQLLHLISQDKSFEEFVIKHIDETVPVVMLHKIAINSKAHCPQQAWLLCRKLYKASQ